MKLYAPVFLLLLTISANAQINNFEPIRFTENSIITTERDTLQVRTLEMLGKQSLNYNTVQITFPSNYDWTADVRRREAIERMTSEIRAQDGTGRDLMEDINRQNTARLINKYFR